MRKIAAVLAVGSMWVVQAQIAPTPSPVSGSRAAQLPLSGRTAQAGSVVPVQTPLPGGVTSVNTINSTVQVQGAYQGSVPSGTFSATPTPLSLDEAVRRGLQYNLGTVGLENSIRQA